MMRIMTRLMLLPRGSEKMASYDVHIDREITF